MPWWIIVLRYNMLISSALLSLYIIMDIIIRPGIARVWNLLLDLP